MWVEASISVNLQGGMGTEHLNEILFICVVCFGVTVCSHVKNMPPTFCTALFVVKLQH